MTALDKQTPEQHRARYLALKAQAARYVAPAQNPDAALLDPEAVIARETIPGGWYWTRIVPRNTVLRIVNTSGSSSVSAMFWNAADTAERYNAGDTVKLQWTAALTKGRVLFSDMGRVLVSIIEDSCGAHDAIVGGSTPLSNLRRYGRADIRNSRDNLYLAAGKYGMTRADVPACLTFFAGISVQQSGALTWRDRVCAPAGFVDLRAEMDLIVALSNCAHPLDPAPLHDPASIEAVLWRAPVQAATDVTRNSSEEVRRGFENNAAVTGGLLV